MATSDWVARDPGNAPRAAMRAQLRREVRQVAARGTRVLVVAPDAAVRQVMGSNSMVVAKRAPVALAVRDYARGVFEQEL